jgi:hypothetical protein
MRRIVAWPPTRNTTASTAMPPGLVEGAQDGEIDAGPRVHEPGSERDHHLDGDERDQAQHAPPAIGDPVPHAVHEQREQQHERGQPGGVPGPVQQMRHPEESDGHSPAAGRPFDGLQPGYHQAGYEGHRHPEQRSTSVEGAAGHAEREAERQPPADTLHAHHEEHAEQDEQPAAEGAAPSGHVRGKGKRQGRAAGGALAG